MRIKLELDEIEWGDLEALEGMSLVELRKFFEKRMVDDEGKPVEVERAREYIRGLKGSQMREFGNEVRKALKELETQAVGGPFGSGS